MFKVNAYVTEIEADNSYEVDIDDVFTTTVTDCGAIDVSVVTFDSALTTVLEIMYGDCDFNFVCRSYKGGACRSYVVAIDDGE
jgi:hypothetical protein